MTTNSPQSQRAFGPALWLIAIALSAIALCMVAQLCGGLERGEALAQDFAASPLPVAANGSRTFAVAGQVSRDSYGLYVIDPEHSTICFYEWLAGEAKLRLRASRNFAFDRQLDEYNTFPSPRQIRDLVDEHRRLTDSAVVAPSSRPAQP